MSTLITKCPKCLHVRRPDETGAPDCCPACGLYFEKWATRDLLAARRNRPGEDEGGDEDEPAWRAALRERLTHIPGAGDMRQLVGRAVILLLLGYWRLRLVAMDFRDGEMGDSFMHIILLPIHEAGHIFFMPFGQFMTILGGSLFQVLLPLIVAAAFLWTNRDPYGAALGVWWCGASWLDLAPYIYDALAPQLILLGGHTGDDGPHDWIYLLAQFGKVSQSQRYGAWAHTFGGLLMLAGLAGATWMVGRMWRVRHVPRD
jgi:hypothetical protein